MTGYRYRDRGNDRPALLYHGCPACGSDAVLAVVESSRLELAHMPPQWYAADMRGGETTCPDCGATLALPGRPADIPTGGENV